MTDLEFQKRCAGTDRCEICFNLLPLIFAYDKSIGEKLLEIQPEGRPTYLCRVCTERLEKEGHLSLANVVAYRAYRERG